MAVLPRRNLTPPKIVDRTATSAANPDPFPPRSSSLNGEPDSEKAVMKSCDCVPAAGAGDADSDAEDRAEEAADCAERRAWARETGLARARGNFGIRRGCGRNQRVVSQRAGVREGADPWCQFHAAGRCGPGGLVSARLCSDMYRCGRIGGGSPPAHPIRLAGAGASLARALSPVPLADMSRDSVAETMLSWDEWTSLADGSSETRDYEY